MGKGPTNLSTLKTSGQGTSTTAPISPETLRRNSWHILGDCRHIYVLECFCCGGCSGLRWSSPCSLSDFSLFTLWSINLDSKDPARRKSSSTPWMLGLEVQVKASVLRAQDFPGKHVGVLQRQNTLGTCTYDIYERIIGAPLRAFRAHLRIASFNLQPLDSP